MMTKRSPLLKLMEPMCQGPASIWGKTRASVALGYQLRTASWRARESPMAVMSGARRGAFLSGR